MPGLGRAVVLLCPLLLVACARPAGVSTGSQLASFERRIEDLRARYQVPAISAIVTHGDSTVWEHASGFADIAAQKRATPATLFHLASLTKPFAAVLALQLEREGKLDLNAPAARYGFMAGGPDSIRVWHLLSHTSQSKPPGTAYAYSGNRYGEMDDIFVAATGQTFAQLFNERIRRVIPLANTAPGSAADMKAIGLQPSDFLSRLAQGYTFKSATGNQPAAYEPYFGTAAGMISTAADVARFSRALDDNTLLDATQRTRMWTAPRSPSGAALPYGIGWFVQVYKGDKVVWHYGLWTGVSALIVKVPARDLTFVILANSSMISEPFGLGAGDLMKSPYAKAFLDTFVK